jgi:glycerophosphoryl diester phosphodiesterase
MARWTPWVLVGLAVAGGVAALALVLVLRPDPQTDPPELPPVRPRDPVLVIAHRGASAYAPHDTVAAAREAVERGADALEADVRQTRDGHLVALFRPSLAPTTDVEQVFPGRAPWRVESFTLAEIRRLDAGSWFAPRFGAERVPTLPELVRVLDGARIDLIVEVKAPRRYPGIAARVAEEVRRRPGRYREIECFAPWFLRRLASRSLPVELGLTGTPPVSRLRSLTQYADDVNPAAGAVDAAYVRRAHQVGLGVKVWSVNTRPAMRRVVGLGVDGVYTHRPDVLADILGRAGTR